MPIGCLSCVPHVAARLMAQRPRSVLDLGVGMGFYGAVVRQWLDNGVRPWTTRLVGVEGWEGYRNPTWELYDEVHVQPMEAFLASQRELFDAILLMDVIEHFPRDTGAEIVEQAKRILSPGGQLFIATPAVWMEQGAAYGNEFERHRALWTAEMLLQLGMSFISDGTTDCFGNRMILGVIASGDPVSDRT